MTPAVTTVNQNNSISVINSAGIDVAKCNKQKAKYIVKQQIGCIVAYDKDTEKPTKVRLDIEFEAMDHEWIEPHYEQCAVCGAEDDLSRHHIVPMRFRKRFNTYYNYHDIVVVCCDCHEEYEKRYAKHYDWNLFDILDLEQNDFKSQQLKQEPKDKKAKTYCAALLNDEDGDIPDDKVKKMKTYIKDYFDVDNLNDEKLIKLLNTKNIIIGQYQNAAQYIADKYDDHNHLAQMWRNHFVKSMEPEHLPPDLQYIIDNEIPLSNLT